MLPDPNCGSGRGRAPAGTGRFTIRLFPRDQQFAQHVQITAQDAQRDVTLEPLFGVVAATLQTIAGLQRANRRLDARMTLARFPEFHRRRRRLGRRLFRTRLRQAWVSNDLRQFDLILGRVETAIERRRLDPSVRPTDKEATWFSHP